LATAPFRLAHLSDLHLGPLPDIRPWQLLSKRVFGYINWRQGRRTSHRTEIVEALLVDLKSQRLDHTVVSGDLVNISLPAEFVAAGNWLRLLGPPDRVTVVPGNHDAYVPLAWHEAWVHWSDYMAGDGRPVPRHAREAFPFLRRRGPVALVGLSSAVASPPTFATGRLGRRQLARLDEMLAGLQGSGCCRVVVVHHPPVRALTAYRRRLVDDKSLGVVLAERGADLVLCGHEHELKLGSLPGPTHRIPVVVAPSASQGAPPKQQGGYLVYTLERHGDRWTVGFELRAFDPEAGIFRTVTAGRVGEALAPATAA
jgi:3',5'-cyclic AMP phosphodiesterase CpdA